MGVCKSSNNNNKELINTTGPGLPPQNIVPQPVEVVNVSPELSTQIVSQ